MTPWTEYSYGAITQGADYMLSLSTELLRKLASQGKDTPPDDVLFLLRQIAGMAESMSHLGDMAKVRTLLKPKD